MADVEDLDMWQRKTIGLVTSIDLVNLERHAKVISGFISPTNKTTTSDSSSYNQYNNLRFLLLQPIQQLEFLPSATNTTT